MKRQWITCASLAALAATTQAVPNIKIVDWGTAPPDGYASVNVVPSIVDLSNPLANVTYKGQIWGTKPGILQFDVQDGPGSAYRRTYLLCVELEQGNENAVYATKLLTGYVGYLANQIPDVVDNPDPGNIKSAALALATWKLDYDGYNPITDTVDVSNLNLTTGSLQYVRTGESMADFTAITNQADEYLAELKMLDPSKVKQWGGYSYYANSDFQDYVGVADVPGPIAALPFVFGVAIGLRRRARR